MGLRENRRRAGLAGAGVLAVLAILVPVFLAPTNTKQGQEEAPGQSLDAHPNYTAYRFGETEQIIDIGIQPLYLPAGLIAEVMKRDAILNQALSAQAFTLRFHPFLKGADLNVFFARGDLEAAMGGDMPVLSACARFEAVVTTLVQQGFASIVARRPMLMKELRGKRIGYAFGSNAHSSLLRALAYAGLDESACDLVPMNVVDMADSLVQGDVDAFAAWEPTPTEALEQHEEFAVIHKSLISGFLYFSRSFADAHPEAIRHLSASVLRAISWTKRNPKNLIEASRWALENASAFSGRESALSVKRYAALARQDLLGGAKVASMPLGDLADNGRLFREFRFLQDLDEIPAAHPWGDVKACFDFSVIEDVLVDWDTYQLDTYAFESVIAP